MLSDQELAALLEALPEPHDLQKRAAAQRDLAALAPALAQEVLGRRRVGQALAKALGQRSAKWHYLDHIIVTPAPFPLTGVGHHTVKWEVCPRSPCRDDRALLEVPDAQAE